MNAVTGEANYYEKDQVPQWIDQLYDSDLIISQLDDNGLFQNCLLYTSVLASEYRGDLTEDGMGTGNYGFHVEIDWDSLPPSSYIISLSSGNTVISRKLRYASGDRCV